MSIEKTLKNINEFSEAVDELNYNNKRLKYMNPDSEEFKWLCDENKKLIDSIDSFISSESMSQ